MALFDDVFVRLVETIEQSSRVLLAIRLGPLSKAPPKVLRILACDNAIDVASPILIKSERLDDPSLIECAKTKSQEHLLAISLRQTLAEAVTDVLVKRSDGDDRLAMCVGARPDIPQQLLEQFFKTASEAVRSKLATENPRVKLDIHRVVRDVTNQIRTQATTQRLEYAAAQVLINSLKRAGQFNAAKLDAFAEAGRFEEIVFASIMSDMPTDFVGRAINNVHAESLLVLSKVIGLSWETTRSLLTLSTRNYPRAAREIEKCLAAFQRLEQPTAQQILGFRRAQGRSRTTRNNVKARHSF